MVIQERGIVNQRPDDVLGDGQALVFQLFFAELDRSAHLLQFGINRQRLLGRGELGFEFFRRVSGGSHLLCGANLRLQLLVAFVFRAKLSEQRLLLGLSALTCILGQDRLDR